jgi:Ca-activated chloride channel family protein
MGENSAPLIRPAAALALIGCALAIFTPFYGALARASQADGEWHPFRPKSGDAKSTVPNAASGPSSPAANQDSTIRVQTNLVSILTSVMDNDGHPVANLPQSAFALTEEGVPQKIERFEAQTSRPVDVALMIDASASTFKDLKFETDAAAHFVQQIVRPGDSLGVFEVSDQVTQIGDFSDEVSRLQSDVRRIQVGSGTSIYDAVVLGANALRRRTPGRRRAIVLVTDAGETTSGAQFEDARRAAIAADELIYTIVIRPIKNENGRNTAGEHALITITDSTGGNMFILDDLSQIASMFDEIDRELRTQYLLGYYPQPTPPPGGDRHIEVKVDGPYKLSYRKEYFAAQ